MKLLLMGMKAQVEDTIGEWWQILLVLIALIGMVIFITQGRGGLDPVDALVGWPQNHVAAKMLRQGKRTVFLHGRLKFM